MNDSESNPLSLERRIDQLCLQFEAAWKAGRKPRIEDYLPHNGRLAALRELIAQEVDLRQAQGTVEPYEYHERFPKDREAVDGAFALLNRPEQQAQLVDTQSLLAGDWPETDGETPTQDSEPIPERLGRFEIQSVLGKGAFGAVYLARDPQLNRLVALKAPRGEHFFTAAELNQFVEEARTAAQLSHPGIVTVYDVAQADQQVFIVQEYIEGLDLARYLKSHSPSTAQVAELMTAIAEAVAFAHQKGFVHRDLKPANILLDNDARPRVADFGLAVHESIQRRRRGERSGTPVYMSPEQVRGETHRLDGRSDIWSLGVILYEMLVGRRPFSGRSRAELFEEIKYREPKPPRQIEPDLSAELERVCLKCLSKRIVDRYSNAADLAADLRHWPEPTTGKPPQAEHAKVIPKGLRSFDARDADFFLGLLAGPRDRAGLPESIRFWKSRIEETDADSTFAVGLIYGPSGCGKTSLVKAGLLPKLASLVTPIYIESTPSDTEVQLLRGLRQRVAGVSKESSLPELLAGLREGAWVASGKILIVLDQFEQWLHAHRGKQDTQLLQALRHCDGAVVQSVLLVRDDFWLATSRFMQGLEIRLLEGENQMLVDLFDPLHARKVLAEFGRAFGRLPDNLGQLSGEQEDFLDRAVQGLARDGKVICIRLALFADMIKGQPWTPATLKDVGGTEGLGESFLEGTFSDTTAPREHQLHQKAARVVLKALLPDEGTDIKGGRQSYAELLETSGYSNQRRVFHDLIRILDRELRLITPTDPEGTNSEGNSLPDAEAGQKYYQLTHDYLVPSLRAWLTRKQRETRRGRAEFRLAERAALWSTKRENRHLPSWWEYLNIVGLTSRRSWTDPQKRMMRAARQYHAAWAAGVLVLLAFVTVSGFAVRHKFLSERERLQQGSLERQNRTRAQGLIDTLVSADTKQVQLIITELHDYGTWAIPLAVTRHAQAVDDVGRLHLSLLLVEEDVRHVEYLYHQLLQANPNRFPVIRDALAKHQERIEEALWTVLAGRDADSGQQRLRAAGALALYDARNAKWPEVAAEVTAQLVRVSPVFLGDWMETLRPIRDKLVGPLSTIFRDTSHNESDRLIAAEVLADYVADQPAELVELLADADEAQFAAVFARLKDHSAIARQLLESELNRTLAPDWHDPPLADDWGPVDMAAVSQIEAGGGLVAERFAMCQSMIVDRFLAVCDALKSSGYRPLRFRPWSRIPHATASDPWPSAGRQEEQDVRVAAIWIRDGRDFRLSHTATPAEIQARDVRLRAEGFLPADVAGYVALIAENLRVARYAALWVERTGDHEDARVFVGCDEVNVAEWNHLHKNGFRTSSMQWMLGPDERPLVSFVRRKQEAQTFSSADGSHSYASINSSVGRLYHDLASAPAAWYESSSDYYTRMLAQSELALQASAGDPTALREHAIAQHGLREDAEAVKELTAVLAQNPQDVRAYMYRAISHARLGQKKDAEADCEKCTQNETHPSLKHFINAVVAAWLGDPNGLERLQAALAEHELDTLWLYNSACAFAIAATAFEGDSERSATCQNRALELLERALTAGFTNFHYDPDLESIWDRAEFQSLVLQWQLDRFYSAVYENESATLESVELCGLSPEEHHAGCKELLSQNYRPVSISAVTLPSQASGYEVAVCSVWQRPRISSDSRLALAKRHATAAIALLRMGEREMFLRVLRVADDPEELTQFVHRSRARGVTAQELWECAELARRSRSSMQGDLRQLEERVLFGLLLALGEFSWEQLTENLRQSAVTELQKWYREDPSATIHGATGWLLRRWQRVNLARQVDETPLAYDLEREWFTLAIPVGETDQVIFQTYVVFPAGDYEIGSPPDELNRSGHEVRHSVRIARPFAILEREITRREFETSGIPIQAYEQGPTVEHAMYGVSWYDSVRFCRWLTTQVGLLEDEQCYVDPSSLESQQYLPDPEDREQAPRDWPLNISRRGFRLPTEAEWEIAARAGVRSPYAFGGDISLLSHYAWFQENSGQRVHLPRVLRPNLLGLFDLHGNVNEWCHNWFGEYPSDLEIDLTKPLSGQRRVRRGGFWSSAAEFCRLASRGSVPPSDHSNAGFRLALTLSVGPTDQWDSRYLLKMALRRLSLARTALNKGNGAEAAMALQEAVEYQMKLDADSLRNADLVHSLLGGYNRAGASDFFKIGSPEAAETIARQKIELIEKRLNDTTRTLSDRMQLAWSYQGLGQALEAQGQIDEAEEATRQALDAWHNLDSESSLNTRNLRLGPIGTFDNMVRLLAALNRLENVQGVWTEFSDTISKREMESLDESTRETISRTCGEFGLALRSAGNLSEAVSALRMRCNLSEALIKDYPENPNHPKSLAWGHHGVGETLRVMNRFEESELEFRKALEVRERLLEDDPDSPARQWQFAWSQEELGTTLHREGKLAEAEELLRTAYDTFGKLADVAPSNEQYQQGHTRSRRRLTELLIKSGRREDAEILLRGAVDFWTKLLKTTPDDAGLRAALLSASEDLTTLLANSDEATPHVDE